MSSDKKCVESEKVEVDICCCCCCCVASVMSDSVQPHRWQPTRLPHPWDSPGKNTGVGCHFLLQVEVKSLSRVQPSATPWTAAFQAPPSMGFSRQEYRSGVPLPSPRGRHIVTANSWIAIVFYYFNMISLFIMYINSYL